MVLFLAEASSKCFAYYYTWQTCYTCYIHHLLKWTLGSISASYTLHGATGNPSTIDLCLWPGTLLWLSKPRHNVVLFNEIPTVYAALQFCGCADFTLAQLHVGSLLVNLVLHVSLLVSLLLKCMYLKHFTMQAM